jgi:hypothetical protein
MLDLTLGATAQLDASGQKRHLILLSAACCGFRAVLFLRGYYPTDLTRGIRPFVDLLLTRRWECEKPPLRAVLKILFLLV